MSVAQRRNAHPRSETLTWISEHPRLPVTGLYRPGVVDGHDPMSRYVEEFWLPVIGPSCVLAARRLSIWLTTSPGLVVDLDEFAGQLGLRGGIGRNAAMVRTLDRLVRFGLARVSHEFEFAMLWPDAPQPRKRERS